MSPARPRILVINPGSTSTKVALFAARTCRFELETRHPARSLARLRRVIDQQDLRLRAVRRALKRHGTDPGEVEVFVGRGGLLRPIPGGVYRVNRRMLADLRAARYGEHASNLGAILAHRLAREHGGQAYVADPVVVDELSDAARLSGHPDLPRRSVFHALSQKAAARKVAARLGRPYRRCNLVVAHVGGGVSVGAHRRGRVVDVNNALEGEGPFSPERTGGLAVLGFCRYVSRRRLSLEAAAGLVQRGGGLKAHLGTNDCGRIERRIRAGDARAAAVYEAFVYQIAKSIGAMVAALAGRVDAIVLTGGVVRGAIFRGKLRRRIGHFAPVYVLMESMEMEALAAAALDAHTGARKVREY